MKFFVDYNNLVLLAIAIASGLLLLWVPIQHRIAGGGDVKVGASAATQFIDRRNAVVADIHGNAEYAIGHLPQAKHTPLGELASKTARFVKNKETPIILACQTGQCAERARAVLKQAGYNEVYSLEDGSAAWQQVGLPVARQRNEVKTMAHVVMYSTIVCPYCMATERLLKQRGVEQIEKILTDRGLGKRGGMMACTNRCMVPQVYIDEHHIGGSDDLSVLDRKGDLVPLLAA